MNASGISRLYDVTYFTLKMNTEGVTHEMSLVSPQPGGNCMNWVVGHILAQRLPILKLAGGEPIWTDADAAVYARGSAPIAGHRQDEARPFESLVADLAKTQQRLKEALARITDDALAAPGIPDVPGGVQPVGAQLAFFNFHESYHSGQVGLLRRLLGLPGMIR
jgi:uncharacterized damage-inducible protein DinB